MLGILKEFEMEPKQMQIDVGTLETFWLHFLIFIGIFAISANSWMK